MGVPPRENDLLRLVHPGRYIEIYREPVIAADIMKKYPRHCIARPDVFKFPWIVVRPESVLVPGKVFYLVPFRTMHELLESKKQQHNQHSSRRNQFDHGHHQNLRLISCMRKPYSVRKLLKLKVTFISPITIPSIPRESPKFQQQVMTS